MRLTNNRDGVTLKNILNSAWNGVKVKKTVATLQRGEKKKSGLLCEPELY